MPELGVIEKLQPCLLDRLTDDEPNNPQESRAQRVISIQRYRQGVLRDLQWLFGSSAHLPQEGQCAFSLEDYPDAFRSVINFGTRHLFGVMMLSMRELERQLTEALYIFEPRIINGTLKVRSRIEGNLVALDVEGDLWASPLPEHLHIKTLLDIEGGFCTLGA
ncbi:MAG TPA: GPW/gp25 family protein [Verrucomicrobiae bacterium]|nr:GPW/gp25 family protein [Verrucomicrobiae bacterium]